MQVETDESEVIERVAALDVGKAEVVCCVRVPGRAVRYATASSRPTRATACRFPAVAVARRP